MKNRITKEVKELENIAQFLLDLCKKKNVDQSEVDIAKSTGLEVSVCNGEPEQINFNKSRVVSLAVFKNGHTGQASSSDLSEAALIKTVEAAVDMASYTEFDPAQGLGSKELMLDENIDLDMLHPVEPNTNFALKESIDLEKACLSRNNPQIKIKEAAYSNQYGASVYANSHDVLLHSTFSAFSKYIYVISNVNGKLNRGFSVSSNCNNNLLDTNDYMADKAITNSLELVGARKIPTGNFPVIFRENVAAAVFNSFLSAISGNSQFRKTTYLPDILGKQVMPEFINIYDNPLIKGKLYSCAYDGNGIRTKEHSLIKNGFVQNYRLSVYTARKLGMQPIGNNYGRTNRFVEDINSKDLGYEDLIKKMDKGIIIVSLMGQGSNAVTGDFSFGFSGFWVENGEIQYPINEMTVAGNFKDLYQNIIAIANDSDPRKSCQVGSILVNNLKIAGI